MSVEYWMNEGLGVKLEDIIKSIDADKVHEYLKNNDAFEHLTEDEFDEWMNEYQHEDNQDRLEMLVEFFLDDDSDLAALIANSDNEHLLSYGNDGDGKYFVFYPPSYPWSRSENECDTEEAARRHILSILLQFTFSDINYPEIEKHIDFIYEVGIG